MKPHRALTCLALLLPVLASAQPRDDRRGPRVILFEHANFQGGAIVLHAGEGAENLARWDFDNGRRANDRISSIRIEGGAEVTVYTDANFRGEALRVTGDIRDLAYGDTGGVRFNDRISSLRVDYRRAPERPPGGGRPPVVDPERVIRRAYQDILEREPDEQGMRHYRSLIIDRGWTERQVREALRDSDEYRGPTMTRRLNRIYQELLGRDADPRGFEHYRDKIVRQGWSDEDVRRDIRNSAEYRNRPRTQGEPERPRRVEAATEPENQN